MTRFSALSQEEIDQLVKAPLYIGLLIAEADGFADEKELDWIEKICNFRKKTAHHSLREYYGKANEEVKANMNLVRSELPESTKDRVEALAVMIGEMKPLLIKLEDRMQSRLIDSYQSLALSVAEISGGLLNFFSMNPAEEKWLSLDMLEDNDE